MGFTADEKHENEDLMKSTPTPQIVIRKHSSLIFHYNVLLFPFEQTSNAVNQNLQGIN